MQTIQENDYWQESENINYTTTVNGIEYSVYHSLCFIHNDIRLLGTPYFRARHVVHKEVRCNGVKTDVRVIKTLMRRDQGIPEEKKVGWD